MFKKLLAKAVGKLLLPTDVSLSVALSFSAGTDSLCLLFVLLDSGFKPKLYTYALEGYESQDLKLANMVAQMYGLSLKVCWIPSDLKRLKIDVKRIIKDGIRGKVNIQCMHGHYYVAPRVKEKFIFNGSGVDGLYGAYRTFAFDGSREDKTIFDKVRRKHLANPNADGMIYQSELYSKMGVKVLYPYRDRKIVDFLMKLSWKEINKPRLKYVAIKNFTQFNFIEKLYRARGSQQLVAGVREFHNQLLDTELNVKKRKSVLWLYKDLVEKYE